MPIFQLTVVDEASAVLTTYVDNTITVTETSNTVLVQAPGPQGAQGLQGIQGIQGTQGIQGVPGPANLVVSPTNPGLTQPGLWVQTGLGSGTDMTFWIEDGT
jgi:hypothetical protein